MLGFEFHPEASAEYDEAVDYYKQINLLLAQAFVLEIEHGIGMICKHPDRWRVVKHETRRYLIHRFPYGIYYSTEQGIVRIWSVMHLSREPGYWKERLGKGE